MKKQKLEYFEIEARRNEQTQVDVSTGEDMMLEINWNPNHSTLHYFINSESTGRKEISRNEAFVYFNNYHKYVSR